MKARTAVAAVVAAAMALGLAACAGQLQLPGATRDIALPYPQGCAAFDLSPRRCEAIVAELARRAGVNMLEAPVIELLGDPGCEGENGGPRVVPCARTTSFVVRVRFRSMIGLAREENVFCGVGGQFSILCTETPEIGLVTPIDNGYRDLPCMGDTPESCATPLPAVDPEADAAEQPLLVTSLDIPIDHVGAYDVLLGSGTLANGILEETSVTLADSQQRDFFLAEQPLWLEVTSLADGGRPFENYYVHGWRPGTEPFSAHLKFEVASFLPGAIIQIREVVVR